MLPRSEGFILKSRRVVTPAGERAAALVVRGGRIAAVVQPEKAPSGLPVVDAGERAVLPGLVDTHAHINEPGRTEWEGFETATDAAAAGGITTVVDMPLNSIPATTTLKGLKAKLAAAVRCRMDVGFWGGAVPGNAKELKPMAAAGALGFKAFLCDSGVEEFKMAREADLRKAMPILKRLGVPLLVHAELADGAPVAPCSRRYKIYLESRPAAWEVAAVRLMVQLCRETGCRVHIVHLSAAEALPDLARAKKEGLPITAETCPHYLALDAESVPDGATHFKCAPPIRGRDNRERLWAALQDGTIDFVVSDHSPCAPELKALDAGDFIRAWGGISSIQFSLPVVWTEMRRRDLSLAQLSRWMSENPARFAGLDSKGAIAPGKDADLVVFDPDAEFDLRPEMIRHRHKLTPYARQTWRGVVVSVFLRGENIYGTGRSLGEPQGRTLLRVAAEKPRASSRKPRVSRSKPRAAAGSRR